MQVGIGIERGFKLLCVDLPILVKDMRVHTCDHVDLCVSRVALCGFQVAVVELQLLSRTGMTERVKNHLRQSCVLTELCKHFKDHSVLARSSVQRKGV